MTGEERVIDPVCGMTIDSRTAVTREHEGETFYFCSDRCVTAFERDAPAFAAVSKLGLQGWGKTPRPGFLRPE